MRSTKQVLAIMVCLLLCLSRAHAQDPQPAVKAGQELSVIIERQQLRFAARSGVAEMRLQVFDQTGEPVYDSGPVGAAEINWPFQNGNGAEIKSGLYSYRLSIKEIGIEPGMEMARMHRGHFILDRAKDRNGADKLWVTAQNDSSVGAELAVAKDEAATVGGAVIGERTIEQRSEPPARDSSGRKLEAEAQSQKVASPGAAAADGGWTQEGNVVRLNDVNNNVGIGTTLPSAKLDVTTGLSSFGFVHTGLLPLGQSVRVGSYVGSSRSGAAGGWLGTISNDPLHLFTNNGQPSLTVATSGNVGINTFNPLARLHVSGGAIRYENDGKVLSFQTGTEVDILSPTNSIVISGRNANGNGHVILNPYQANDPNPAFRSGNVGIGTFTPQAKLHVVGTTITGVLQINNGADFSENFDVNAAASGNVPIEPGLVVTIDPAEPAKLSLSARAYDRRVVGVISGAGGVKPGMVMGQEGTLADGKHPVALSGRVYCWVDATRGAIKPGDLLTTSPTPGHAMKATNPAKSRGAIIGKAMTGLMAGKGLVLVLVTLQ